MSTPDRSLARRLAHESLARGDATGWFETLYASGEPVPWVDLAPNPFLVDWPGIVAVPAGARALVVGCGLGDDAEWLAARGLAVTAFDVAPSAVEGCRARFPDSTVAYEVADALALPGAWRGAFDLVVEIYTLQVLPPEPRAKAAAELAGTVAPGGTLLVVARGREPEEPPGEMPWPLTRADLEVLTAAGLTETAFEELLDDAEDSPVRRFRVAYRR